MKTGLHRVPKFNIVLLILLLFVMSCGPLGTDPEPEKEEPKEEEEVAEHGDYPEHLKGIFEMLSYEHDTTSVIKYEDFQVKIHGLQLWVNIESQSSSDDSLFYFIDESQLPDGHTISVTSDLLFDFNIKERYQTSAVISGVDDYCILTGWKNYYSRYEALKYEFGYFIIQDYENEDYDQFLEVDLNEYKVFAREHCGKDYYEIIDTLNSIRQFPAGIDLSRYYFEITAKRKDDGELVRKTIVFGS